MISTPTTPFPNHLSPCSPCSPCSLHLRLPCYVTLYPINTPAPSLRGARFEICSPVYSLAALWISPVFATNLGCFSVFGLLCFWQREPGLDKSPSKEKSKIPVNCLCQVADRIFVLRPDVRPKPLRWESRVQDIGPPEASWPHVISLSESSLRDLCWNAKTQLHSMTSKL